MSTGVTKENHYRQNIRSALIREFLGGVKAMDSHAVLEAFEYLIDNDIDPIKVFIEEVKKLNGNSSC